MRMTTADSDEINTVSRSTAIDKQNVFLKGERVRTKPGENPAEGC